MNYVGWLTYLKSLAKKLAYSPIVITILLSPVPAISAVENSGKSKFKMPNIIQV